MKNKKNEEKIMYAICFIFSILAIFILLSSDEKEDILMSIMILLFFGGGAISIHFLYKQKNKEIFRQEGTLTITANRSKMIVLLFSCLVFVFACCITLYLLSYRSIGDYIIGAICTAGILFFGYGLIATIIQLIKRSSILQISDEGILVRKGISKQIFIAWKDIEEIVANHAYLCIYLKNADLYPVDKLTNFINKFFTGTNINIPVPFIDYDINQLESLMRNKMKKINK